ncbi:hypothetical protein KUTeg_023366 [Tegillarca granosa]|uniref:Uncharacterized protein n=1 Tax=Tegillarca granosa TaxID=220873 RepID=A0ABQ9E6D1_TEGGR|nr:hypothetical protein KUTeg_023366 [Tegillarca granosa]
MYTNDKKPFNQKIIDEMMLECNAEKEAKKTKKEKEKEKKDKKENTENKEKKKKSLGRNYYKDDDDEEQISSKNERSRSGRTVKRRFDSSFVEDFEDEGKYPVASWDVESGDKEKDRGEVVDILMNMREGKVPKTSEIPQTSTSQGNNQVQNIQVSGLSDGGPFILVYSQPGPDAAPDAETVIHVYKLQGDIGDLSGIVGGTNNNSTDGANTQSSSNGNNDGVVCVEYKTNHMEPGQSFVDNHDNYIESRTENQSTVEVENEMSFVPFIPPPCQARQGTISPVLSHQVEESHALDEDNVVYVSYGDVGYNSELVEDTLPSSSDFNKTVQVEYTNENSSLQNSSLTHHEIPEENINCIDVPKTEGDSDMSQVDTNWKGCGDDDVSGTENQDSVMTSLRDSDLTSSSENCWYAVNFCDTNIVNS